MGLSIIYFILICILSVLAIVFTISATKPGKPRLRGLYIFGIGLLYVAIWAGFSDLWGHLMYKWYGQWGGFVFGIIFGIIAFVITAGTAIYIIVMALYTVILGRFPAWVEGIQLRSVGNRLSIGLVMVFALVFLAGFVLSVVLRNP